MVFKDTELILDNFRRILDEYSVDVQDVVRSAILDGCDISEYINPCRDNPYRLDQIRLAKKQGLSSQFYRLSGELIYEVRKLKEGGFDLRELEGQVTTSLSESNISYLIKWVRNGTFKHGLKVCIIPKGLLEVFDTGLKLGVDMRIFNTGKVYSAEYVQACIVILMNNRDVTPFLSGNWNLEVLKILGQLSAVHIGYSWDNLISMIDSSTPVNEVCWLTSFARRGFPIDKLYTDEGYFRFDRDCLAILTNAVDSGYDYTSLLDAKNSKEMESIYQSLKLSEKRKIGGKIVKNISRPG